MNGSIERWAEASNYRYKDTSELIGLVNNIEVWRREAEYGAEPTLIELHSSGYEATFSFAAEDIGEIAGLVEESGSDE